MDESSMWGGIIDQALEQQPIKQIFNKVGGFLDNANRVMDRVAAGNFEDVENLINRLKKPKVKYEPVTAPPREDPRALLGFKVGEAITETMVKERRKKFAKILHPDAGGSETMMQKVNEACDTLLKEIRGK